MTRPRTPSSDEPAHDVLAAEEFGVPAPDPGLHHGPVTLPGDPTGIVEPHDVLAAEEFAMPAPRYGGGEPYGMGQRRGLGRPRWLLAAAAAFVVFRRLGRNRRT